MSTLTFPLAAIGYKALVLMYFWLAGCIVGGELSRSKGYGEKAGLGTGLLLSALAAPIWLAFPARDNLAEWHQRKPTFAIGAAIGLIVAMVVAIILSIV